MGLIISVFLLGVLASLSPSTIVIFILLLATARARVNAIAFIVGYVLSLVVIFLASYQLGIANFTQYDGGPQVVDVVEMLVGIALIGAAGREWRRRHAPKKPPGKSKGLTGRLKHLSPWEATVVGILEQPWTLTAAAAVVVVRHHAGWIVVLIAFAVFMVLSTATVGVIFLYYARRPGEAQAHLTALKDRLVEAGPTVFAVVSLVAGLFLLIDGFIDLVR